MPEVLAAGRYRVGELLGEGGMARVYRAHDQELGVDRAVKILTHAGKKSIRQRLRNEARAMARLRHPNILGIHDVGQEGELDYIVMDLAPGGSLQDRVARGGPLPMGDAIAVTLKVLSALATAHAAGIVHRDVKPHNVLLDANDQPLLADFGIAMLAEADRSTKTGVAMGSLAFMPPEQRLDAAHVGPTADIYATGCTLFAVLTDDNPVDLFLAHASSERWAGVPEPLRKVVQTACAPHASDRYPTARDMADALLAVLDAMGAEERDRALNSRGFFPAPSQALSARSGTTSTAPPAPVPVPVPVPHPPTIDSGAVTTMDARPAARAPERGRGPLVAAVVVGLLLFGLGGSWLLFAPAREAPMEATEPVAPPAQAPVAAPSPPEPEPAPEPAPAPAPAPEPVPELEPEPTPVPVAPEPRPAPGPVSAVGGAWVGGLNGRQVRLELSGQDEALRGSFDTTWAGRTDRSRVAGRFDGARLILEDVDERPDGGRYELDLLDDRLKGFFVRNAGGKVPLQLYRPKG